MGQYNYKTKILFGFLLGLLVGSLLIFSLTQRTNLSISKGGVKSLNSAQSSDPSNPHILYDDSSVYDYYNASTSYYYRTENASLSYYHVMWLQPQDAQDNFDLYLYSDSGYSNLKTFSNRPAGYLDWVVFRPIATQFLYVKVNTLSGYSGFTFLEWEDSSYNLPIGNSTSNYLSSPDSLEVYQVFLSNTSTYRFRLDVPSQGDFDLYLYHLTPGQGANYGGYDAQSKTSGNGVIEIISNYTPTENGYYALFVVRYSGSGTYTLSASELPTIPQILSNDISLNESYNASASAYYKINTASSSHYHVVWLQSQAAQDNFDLYLFSDSKYSTCKVSSLRGNGLLDWVVFRPSISQSFYPEVYAQAGSNGFAFIEWEDSSESLSIETPVSASLNSSDCIEIYETSLSALFDYQFTLNVPDGADYDLYLYSLSSGAATNSLGSSCKSTLSGNGTDEIIATFSPTVTGIYVLFVVRVNGTGFFTLSMFSIQDLHDASSEYVQYNAPASYYYRTGTASSIYYHVVWVQPTDMLDNFDLFLYSNADYSTYNGSSQNENGFLDWIIFRPSTSQIFYPQVSPISGSTGYAYIEWEDSRILYFSSSGSLSASNCIDIYYTSLSSFSTYKFTLEVPSDGDFDLYLFYLNSGTAMNSSGALQSSTTSGNGISESILKFTPTEYGTYAVLVVRTNGSGIYTLSLGYDTNFFWGPYTYYIFLLAGAGIAGLIVITVLSIKKRRSRNQPL